RPETVLYNIIQDTKIVFPENVYDFDLINDRFFQLEMNDKTYQLMNQKGDLLYANPQWRSTGSILLKGFPQYDAHAKNEFYHGLKKIYSNEGNLFIDE